jgi:hypothetical protein
MVTGMGGGDYGMDARSRYLGLHVVLALLPVFAAPASAGPGSQPAVAYGTVVALAGTLALHR